MKFLGTTQVKPETFFFWEPENKAVVEITFLDPAYLVRVSKSYRMLKQDEQGRETWQRNLSKLNDYLASSFSHFQISVDYSDNTVLESISSSTELEQLARETEELVNRRQKIQNKVNNLENSLNQSLDKFKPAIQSKIEVNQERYAEIEERLHTIQQHVEREKQKRNEWSDKGVSTAFLFTFSTDPVIAQPEELDPVIENQLQEAFNLHRRRIKQTLQGENWRLVVEENTEPRIFNRLQYTGLIKPESLEQLKEAHPRHEALLEKLYEDQVQQYTSYALQDIEIEGGVIERSKTTPAQAVRSLIQQLETEKVANTANIPNNGPILGTATGTEIPAGIDPASIPHFYIVGSTGSGKSYTKRVLLENCLSLGYNTISVTPRDIQALGAAFAYAENENGRGLSGDYYWLGNDKFQDLPDNTSELIDGASFITLQGTSKADKDDFITQLFTEVADQGQLDQPLFIFLDEAHLFAEGSPAEAIQKAVRQTRKFGVHVVLITQSPMDFNYNYKHIRENTQGNFFLQGEYFDYADQLLDDSSIITDLEQGNSIFLGRGQEQVEIEVRKPLSQVEEPSDAQLKKLENLVNPVDPEPSAWDSGKRVEASGTAADAVQGSARASSGGSGRSSGAVELTDDEREVIEGIRNYVADEDQLPSKNKAIEYSPFGTSKTTRILEQLAEKEAVETGTEERYGNNATVYQVKNTSK